MCAILLVVVVIFVFCAVADAADSFVDDPLFSDAASSFEAFLNGSWQFASHSLATGADELERIFTHSSAAEAPGIISTPAPILPGAEQVHSSLQGTIAWAGAQFAEQEQWAPGFQATPDEPARPGPNAPSQALLSDDTATAEQTPGSATTPSPYGPFTLTLRQYPLPDSALTTTELPTSSPPSLVTNTTLGSELHNAFPRRSVSARQNVHRPRAAQGYARNLPRPRSEPDTRSRPHHCTHTDCSASFATVSDLRHHRRYHIPPEQRRHACIICGNRFLFPRDVERHMNTHGDEHCTQRHFCPHTACQYHTQGFRRRDHLLRHVRALHGEPMPPPMVPHENPVKSEPEGDMVDPFAWLI